MSSPPDQRLILGLGAGAAVVLAVVVAFALSGREEGPAEPPPASKGGLELEVSEAPTLDPDRQLRCFVDGQFVGMATLAACAERNGVAAQALDVGLDGSGELTAAPTASLAPPPDLPPLVEEAEPAETAPEPVETADPAPRPAAATAACWRHTGSEWRQVSASMSRSACVQLLFQGVCESPGGARYGRWGETTLRLVPRRVEQSFDNQRFGTLVEQGRNCSIPEID